MGLMGSGQQQGSSYGAGLSQLGRLIFFDRTLSNPVGMSCASCHAANTGYTLPNSDINQQFGTAPGAVVGRFGSRKTPSISYASYSPQGPLFNNNLKAWVGGQMWDGRATDLAAQVPGPLFNANEMNLGLHNLPGPAVVVATIARGGYARQFQQVFGANVFNQPPQQVMLLIGQAIAAWEATPEVSPFRSKYDAMLVGLAKFNPSEANGLKLATGSANGRPGGPAFKNARCAECHSIPGNRAFGPDLWTNFAFINTGIPRNPNNPFYAQINAQANPQGFNPQGNAFVDLGLGAVFYPARNLPAGNLGAGNNGLGDFLAVNGTFKTPTLRNVDKRPNQAFVKAYGHNGVFKSLDQIVHFYNTRNLTTEPGEVIDFTRPNPYAGLVGRPLWAPPEVASPTTLRNPTGAAGQIGNLGLTLQEEADLIAFLKTLTDL